MQDFDNGTLTFHHVGGRLALTVRFGAIVACDPPRDWPIGRAAVDLWHDATLYGAKLEWEASKQCRSKTVKPPASPS